MLPTIVIRLIFLFSIFFLSRLISLRYNYANEKFLEIIRLPSQSARKQGNFDFTPLTDI